MPRRHAFQYNIGYAIVGIIFLGLVLIVFFSEKIPAYGDTDTRSSNASFESSNDLSD